MLRFPFFAVRRGYLCLALCLSLVPGNLRSEEIQVGSVRKSFAKTGFIIVSGTVQGRDVNCLIDTGASENMVDIKLEETLMGLKQTNDSNRLTTFGLTSGRLFHGVEMSLSGLKSEIHSVGLFDLKTMSEASGVRLDAILGVRSLKKYALQFDGGVPKVLTAVDGLPKGKFDRIPLQRHLGCPVFEIELPVMGTIPAIVDTGADAALCVRAEVSDFLLRSGNAVELPPMQSVTPEGRAANLRRLVIRNVRILEKDFHDVPAVVGAVNFVGNDLLRRMAVVIDFEQESLFYPRVGRVGSDDQSQFIVDASGLRLVWDQTGFWKVRRIVDETPATKADIAVSDQVLTINGESAIDLTCWEIREKLSRSGEVVQLDLLRNGKALTVELALEHPFEYPPKWKPRAADADEFFESLQKDESKK